MIYDNNIKITLYPERASASTSPQSFLRNQRDSKHSASSRALRHAQITLLSHRTLEDFTVAKEVTHDNQEEANEQHGEAHADALALTHCGCGWKESSYRHPTTTQPGHPNLTPLGVCLNRSYYTGVFTQIPCFLTPSPSSPASGD